MRARQISFKRYFLFLKLLTKSLISAMQATNLRDLEVDALKKKLGASEASLVDAQNSLKHRTSELEVLKEGISKLKQLEDDNKDKGLSL
jgi:hypothetical protein